MKKGHRSSFFFLLRPPKKRGVELNVHGLSLSRLRQACGFSREFECGDNGEQSRRVKDARKKRNKKSDDVIKLLLLPAGFHASAFFFFSFFSSSSTSTSLARSLALSFLSLSLLLSLSFPDGEKRSSPFPDPFLPCHRNCFSNARLESSKVQKEKERKKDAEGLWPPPSSFCRRLAASPLRPSLFSLYL